MEGHRFNLSIKQDVCVRCGACVVSYPDIFEFAPNGDIQVKKDVEEAKLEEVKGVCPVGAIV